VVGALLIITGLLALEVLAVALLAPGITAHRALTVLLILAVVADQVDITQIKADQVALA
jgi:hypothetical protein